MSIGLLILRLVLGGLFVGHGTQKLFGWFGGGGPSGTGSTFERAGYRPGPVLAVSAGLAEAGGGALLALGLLTPLGAAAVIGVMANAILAVHARNGVWNTKGGVEFPLTNAAAACALGFTGPGTYSIDHALGLLPGHVASGVFALGLGLLVGLFVFALRGSPVRRGADADRTEPRRAA